MKQELSIIKTRIVTFLSEEGLRPADFYRRTGVAKGVLSQPSGVTESVLLKFFAAYPTANPEWVILGTGPRLRGDVSTRGEFSTAAPASPSTGGEMSTESGVDLSAEVVRLRAERDALMGEKVRLMEQIIGLQRRLLEGGADG